MDFTTNTKLAKPQNKAIAYSRVTVGPVWVDVSVEEGKDGRVFVNAPSVFVESAKSDTNTGFIQKAGFEKDFWPKVREKVLADLASLQSPTE